MVLLRFVSAVSMILLVLSPVVAHARWSLTPRIYLQEQYDDNLFLTETREEDDFITTISPGLNLAYETPTENLSLDYELQSVLHSDFSELDYTGHRGQVDVRKGFGPRFSAGIRDVLIRSEDPIELTGISTFERPSIRTGRRNRYTRNIVEPDVTFQFYEDCSIRVGYRNQILRNKANDVADFDENAMNGLLNFRFDIHNSFEAFYEHIVLDYDPTVPPEPSREFVGDQIRGRYTYDFDPRTSAFLQYQFYRKDIDQRSPGFVDYMVHDPRVGLSRELYENVSASASAGYAFRDAGGPGDDEESFSGEMSVSGEYKRLSAEVYGQTGFQDDFRSAEILGFNEFWRAGFNGRYQILERFWAGGFFYFERDRFVDLDDRTDKFWNVRGTLEYRLLKWLFLSFDYVYNKRDSNIPFENYTDNRYFGRLTAQYDIAEHFQ